MRLIISLIALILFNNCTQYKYVVRGTILDILPISNEFLIHHDEIPNFMMAMTMPFYLKDSTDINKFSIGDSVIFTLNIFKNEKAYASNFKFLGKGTIPNYKDFFTDDYSPIEIGEIINDINLLTLDSNKFYLSNSDGKFRLISFIFSRCPMPSMCPAVIVKNQYIADTFIKNNNFELIIISFDHLHDTPSMLKSIYGNIENKLPNIKFLSSTNHLNDLFTIAGQSNVSFWGVDENDIGHTLRSILIDPNRRLLKAYEGTEWNPENLINDLNNLIKVYN